LRVGATVSTRGGTTYRLQRIFRHQSFDPITFDFDVAVVQVNGKITLKNVAKRVELAAVDTVEKDGTACIVAGYGLTMEWI
jgi:hypothetical protein